MSSANNIANVHQHWLDDCCKRLFDICAAFTALLLLWPLLMFIALLIRLDSPGPVFYRGVRTGRFGKTFRIFKFRSMVVGADKEAQTTAQHDARVTHVGSFIRRYKIDELPQLINVLLGEMSFVGPRPELPLYTERYTGEELCILQVRPGITDFSSIYFIQLGDVVGNNDPDRVFEEQFLPLKNQLRIKYVKERNLWVDFRLIVATLLKIGKRDWNTANSDKQT